MSEYFSKPKSLGENVKFELDSSDVDKLDIDKLVTLPVDLSKLSV